MICEISDNAWNALRRLFNHAKNDESYDDLFFIIGCVGEGPDADTEALIIENVCFVRAKATK